MSLFEDRSGALVKRLAAHASWPAYCTEPLVMGRVLEMNVRDPGNILTLGGHPARSHRSVSRARECGQSLIELAFVIPFLLLVGIIEIGRFAFYSIVVANAARAGAQYGAQSLATAADTTGISTAVTD